MNAAQELSLRLSTPDVLTAMPWTLNGQSTEKFERFKQFLATKSLRIPKRPIALRGGRMLAPDKGLVDEKTGEHLALERSLAVIPAIAGDGQQLNRVIHYPTEQKDIHFSANLAGYRELVAACVAGGWDEANLGKFPIPIAESTGKIEDGYISVTEYRPGIRSLGLDGPKKGIHQMDVKKISLEETRRLVRVLDAVHIDSDAFLGWLDSYDVKKIPPGESWLNEQNPKCALRGQEWWINENASDDRLRELGRHIDEVVNLYPDADKDFDIKKALKTMIENNLPLYRHQNGTLDEADRDLLGEDVVVHGTLYPDQIHIRQDSSGKINYTITGGDRAQLYGLRGQMIDWLVSASAASPEHQKALIEEFIQIQKDMKRDAMKELRGLAMHVMYRCISETPWFVKEGKTEESLNLVKMTHEILQGKGIWEGVNKPMKK